MPEKEECDGNCTFPFYTITKRTLFNSKSIVGIAVIFTALMLLKQHGK